MTSFDNKCEIKQKLKQWETAFKLVNGRKPLKDDIKNAPITIKELYKKYWNVESPQQTNSEVLDDVWGSHLNKDNEPSLKQKLHKPSSCLDHLANKIRASYLTNLNTENNNSKIKRKQLISKPESSQSSDSNIKLDIASQEHIIVNEEKNCSVIHFDALLPVKTSRSFSPNVQPINAITKLSSNKLNYKEKCRHSSINKEWLDRCDASFNKSLLEKDNPKEEYISLCNTDFSEAKTFSPKLSKLDEKTILETKYNNSETKQNEVNTTLSFEGSRKPITETFMEKSPQKSLNNSSLIKNTEMENNTDSSSRIDIVETTLNSAKRKIDCSFNEPQEYSPINHERIHLRSDFEGVEKEKFSSKQSEEIERKRLRLQKKLDTGTVNENYVRINLKKKKFYRGKKQFSGVQYKRKIWKNRQRFRNRIQCEEDGYWNKNFPKKSKYSNTLIPIDHLNAEEEEETDSPFLTLEEAATLALGFKTNPKENVVQVFSRAKNDKSDDEHLLNVHDQDEKQGNVSKNLESDSERLESLISPENGDETKSLPEWVYKGLKKFGHESFRPCQEQAIMRILSGLSTLLVLSTGAGKSLCYQLPAFLYAQKYRCITLVISPLVSLMEDQVTDLPGCLKAACLHSHLSESQRQGVIESVKNGQIHVLIVCPESVVGSKGSGLGGMFHDLPSVAFAVIDEIHCLSEWSHNFRPSYLQLCKVLKERFKVNCILGLTATASKATALSIAKHLDIMNDISAIIRGASLPANLVLSVSRDENRDEALISLLQSESFSLFNSIIVYCTRREETERIATLIRINIHEDITKESKKSRYNLSWAEAYHAGLTNAKRRSIQKHFMSGKLRIIVATVAFGMGLDKRDVRAVIHYNMPRSFESYVQEIGRAGRDGEKSLCHLFLNSEGNDLCELQRHIYSNAVDRSVLRKLLKKIFSPCKCKSLSENFNDIPNKDDCSCPGHEVAIPINDIIQELDLKQEAIATLLCYLESAFPKWIQVLNPVYSMCKIQCYGGKKQLKLAARKCPPLAAAIALDRLNGRSHENSSSIEFPVVSVASLMGWDSGVTKRELKSLEWNLNPHQGSKKNARSGISVEFSELAFHLRSAGDLNDSELDEVLDYLHSRVNQQQDVELFQLKQIFESLHSISFESFDEYENNQETVLKSSNTLKNIINEYFEETEEEKIKPKFESTIMKALSEDKENFVQANIRSFLQIYQDQTFTGRAVARIFSGIGSPCFPAETWGRVRRFWRCHLDVDFNLLCKLATQEILKLK